MTAPSSDPVGCRKAEDAFSHSGDESLGPERNPLFPLCNGALKFGPARAYPLPA